MDVNRHLSEARSCWKICRYLAKHSSLLLNTKSYISLSRLSSESNSGLFWPWPWPRPWSDSRQFVPPLHLLMSVTRFTLNEAAADQWDQWELLATCQGSGEWEGGRREWEDVSGIGGRNPFHSNISIVLFHNCIKISSMWQCSVMAKTRQKRYQSCSCVLWESL